MAALLALSLALVGCAGSAKRAADRSSASPTPSATAPPPKPQACGAGATAFWLPGPGGSKLEANAIGSGRDAVIFLHEVGSTGMCGFWPYARWLASHRQVRAILVNRCGYGHTTCASAPKGDAGIVAETKPAVDWARQRGAHRVTIVGASAGGGDALQAGGAIPGIAAVVDLSGDGNDTGASDGADAKRLTVPILFAVAPNDRYVSVSEVRHLYNLVPAHHKRLVIDRAHPGWHGWDLLFDGDKITRLSKTVAAWITGKAPARGRMVPTTPR